MLNKTLLIGRIVESDLQVKQSQTGFEILYFTIANSQSFYNKNEQKWDSKTSFIPVKAFGKMALYISKHFKKGDLVQIEAKLNVESSKLDDGNYKTFWSVVVNDIELLSKSLNSKTQEIDLTNTNIGVDVAPSDNNLENNEDRPWELDL